MHFGRELIRELPPFWQSQICYGFEPAVCDEVKSELLINNKTSCMKTSHSFGIDFIVRKQKNENAQGLLYARITVDGKVHNPVKLTHSFRSKLTHIFAGKEFDYMSPSHLA